MTDEKRASYEEIFLHLHDLLGDNAVNAAEEVAKQYIDGDKEKALNTLKEFDATIGGVGLYRSKGKKLPGIYRALSYNEIPMVQGIAHEDGRFMIDASCGYLEELIKKLVVVWPWERIADRGITLGGLINRIKHRLPEDLVKEMNWLNGKVYVFAKHHYNLEDIDQEEKEPEHYFELDEAIAIYFIVRKLGRKLEELSGRPNETFLEGWQLDDD